MLKHMGWLVQYQYRRNRRSVNLNEITFGNIRVLDCRYSILIVPVPVLVNYDRIPVVLGTNPKEGRTHGELELLDGCHRYQ